MVPGAARVRGDSELNDIVPALLSPGELVIPRSVVEMGPDAIADFAAYAGPDKGMDSKAGEVLSLLEGLGVKPLKRNLFDDVVDWVGDAAGGAWDAISGAAKDVYNFAEDVGGAVWEEVKNLPANIVGALGGLGDTVLDIVRFLIDAGGSIDWTRLVSDPVGAIGDALKGMVGFLKEIFMPWIKSNAGGGGQPQTMGIPPKPFSFDFDFDLSNLNIDPGSIGAIRLQQGGLVPGTGNGDIIPAMLEPGEFVINRQAARNIGMGALSALNSGQGMGETNIEVNLDIKTTQPIDERFVREKMMPMIKRELKRASVDGTRILAPEGVR
jgi:hypothetical protein